MIYLRCENDSNGDVVENNWYCSETCYRDSLTSRPAVGGALETGGAYPCGSESDSPDFCATCGSPVGNPLTSDGMELVRDWIANKSFHVATDADAERMERLEYIYA